MKTEFGGYIEYEYNHGQMLHDEAVHLNCGRRALSYLAKSRQIRNVWIPKFSCGSVTEPFEKEKCEVRLYSVREDFSPDLTGIPEDDWVVLINYYGQIDNEKIREIAGTHPRLIVDNTQAYFQMPVAGLDTVYTCRKFFGVTDGAILYTDKPMEDDFPTDESFERMTYILGRFERTAQEFYELYDKNNSFFENEPIKKMSKLTHNILCGLDYEFIRTRRSENFRYLNDRLGNMNALKLKNPEGAFMQSQRLLYLQKIRQSVGLIKYL